LREALRHRIAAERLLEAQAPAAALTASVRDESADGGRPADSVPPDDLPRVPGYTVVRELGCGGMGVVYEAVQSGLSRPVALKMLLPDRRTGGHAAVRFLAEAEAVAAVRHPHVIQVYEFGESAGRPYIAMELCPRSLKDVLRAGPLPPRDAARLVAKVAQGVQAAHAQQIVHRDLKPGNVLLDPDGEPKVTDFGLAKRGAGSDLTRTHAVLGTPAYMAPEQAEGRAKFVGPAADVWALGVILYECLTGVRPFATDDPVATRHHIQEAPLIPLRSVKRDTPRDLDVICRKCLEKAPADRYPTAAAVAIDLDNFLEGRPILAHRRTAIDRAWRFCAARPVETCLVLLFVVLFLRFIVSNSQNFVGAGLPPETNADLRAVANAAFIGAVGGALVGCCVAVSGLAWGRRLSGPKTIARAAIAGLAVFAVLGIIIPSIGTNANATFSAVGPVFPAGGPRRGETARVLVAKRDIPVGTRFGHDDLDEWIRWADVPKAEVPPNPATELGLFDGAVAIRAMRAGDPVAARDLSRHAPVVVPDGHRLITVRDRFSSAVAGQIAPGSRVDVVFTRRDGPAGQTTEPVLTGVTVLGVETESNATGSVWPSIAVTISVNAEQAKAVALAEGRGALRVVPAK
jgi:Flp pilus assembly protein CpaB